MSYYQSNIRYLAVMWLTLAAALAYLCRNAIGVAESTIRADLDLSMSQSGWFMGCFFWTYALFQIPTGWFSERVGSRLACTLYAIGWSIAVIGISISPWCWLLIAAQLLMGISQAGIFPASCSSIGTWMPISERSTACGFLTAGMQVGAIIAATLTGGLMLYVGWRLMFVLYALPGLIWAIVFFTWFRNRPEQVISISSRELELISAGCESESQSQPQKSSEWQELLSIFQSPMMWLLCGQQICRGAGYMFFASWFPTFLQQTRGVTVVQSGLLQGLVFAGTLGGCLIGGTATDWIWRRTNSLRLSRSGVGAAALAACGLLILSAWFVSSPGLAVSLIATGAFCAALAGPCAFATTIDIGGTRVPQIFGTMNMFGNFAAASCPVLVAWFFEWTANWNLVLLLFAGVYLAGAICWIFVNPTHPIRQEHRGSQ
jgi:ACS family glucarate transporter-like MFS transporter/ACS family D-galactonate transporter-like MFS transporter